MNRSENHVRLRTLGRRLQKLESTAQSTAQLSLEWLDEDWLQHFALLGTPDGLCREPDYPKALDLYRQAIEAAKAQVDPNFDPPPAFLPGRDHHTRFRQWRDRPRFTAVRDCWRWLAAMERRFYDNELPPSEAEFASLANWFEANADRLRRLAGPSHLFEWRPGEWTDATNIRCGICSGPRTFDAGKWAKILRALRVRYGDGPDL